MSEPDAKKRYYHSGPEGDNKIISKDTIVLSVSRTF